jgi:murein DD-endopeptidase MepM/ murein hydrolase activator NlpD
LVEPGQVVHTAQRLGIEGTSGSSDGIHLHYTIYGAKHTSSIANFDDVYANAIGGDQSAKEVLFTVGGIHTSYSSDRNSLNADTELANVYMSTRLLYETVTRDAGTSDPLEIRDWGINARGRNNYIAILCVGGENSLEGSYTNLNVWRPFG